MKIHRLNQENGGLTVVADGHVLPASFVKLVDTDDVEHFLGDAFKGDRSGCYPSRQDTKRLASRVVHTWGAWSGKRWQETHKDERGSSPFTMIAD